MRDQFRGKTWIFWAQLIGCGCLGMFSLIFGTLFWSGAMTDANGQVRREAGPPMVIIGFCLAAVAVKAAVDIAARVGPVIRCYREGIECKIIGATSLDGMPVPGLVRIAWGLVSLQSFRSRRLRVEWSHFRGAEVGGYPMAYVLTLSGGFTNLTDGGVVDVVRFQQVALRTHPEQVADALNHFACDADLRDRLASWGHGSRELEEMSGASQQ